MTNVQDEDELSSGSVSEADIESNADESKNGSSVDASWISLDEPTPAEAASSSGASSASLIDAPEGEKV